MIDTCSSGGARLNSLSACLNARRTRTPRYLRARMLVYPTVAFLRYYLWRGHWRGGWAGFIAARVHAFYAFLKYAKLYERRVSGRLGKAASPPAKGIDE